MAKTSVKGLITVPPSEKVDLLDPEIESLLRTQWEKILNGTEPVLSEQETKAENDAAILRLEDIIAQIEAMRGNPPQP